MFSPHLPLRFPGRALCDRGLAILRRVPAGLSRTLDSLARSLAALALSLGCAIPSLAQTSDEPVTGATAARLKTAIEQHTGGRVQVSQIRRTPVASLFQVESNREIFYVDETGRYAFNGASLIDMQLRQDLTAQQMERVMAVDFNALPLQHAIKEVRGNGQRKFAVFEDPQCPICRSLTQFVDQLGDVTVYRFMFPVIDPASAALARVAWCSSDRAATWRAVMAGARPTGRQDCDTRGLVAILKAGEQHDIQNTPTVFLASGKRLVGATPPEQFMAELDAASRPSSSRSASTSSRGR